MSTSPGTWQSLLLWSDTEVEIYGIGTDIIETSRIKKALERSKRFRDRVFTTAEQDYCEAKKLQKYESYASRYAAKEAIAKSLGSGFGTDLSLNEIEINTPPGSPPEVRFYAGSRSFKRGLGIRQVKVSLSAVRDYALAYAVSLV